MLLFRTWILNSDLQRFVCLKAPGWFLDFRATVPGRSYRCPGCSAGQGATLPPGPRAPHSSTEEQTMTRHYP